ncbi:hypothetical protein PFISCL1PPCAC_8558, partial [Pristionchus fissidentatus]
FKRLDKLADLLLDEIEEESPTGAVHKKPVFEEDELNELERYNTGHPDMCKLRRLRAFLYYLEAEMARAPLVEWWIDQEKNQDD